MSGPMVFFGGVRTLTDDDLDFPLLSLPKDFEMRIEVFLFLLLFYAMVPYRLLSFVVDILNQEMGRNVEVIQRQGVLLVENGQLLHVELPKEGVDVEAFFGDKQGQRNLY